MYQERASTVPGAVVWTRPATPHAGTHRVLPDGCLDLIWHDGALLVAGPDRRATVERGTSGSGYAAIRYPPGLAPAVLGVPAHELCGRRVALGDLWPAATVRAAVDAVAAAARPGVALEELSLRRMRSSPPDPLARFVAGRLHRGASAATVAAEVGLSDRHLRRRCLSAFGYGPKTLARILRLQRALALADRRWADAAGPLGGGHGLAGAAPLAGAALAAAAGYADQAHLAREVRALAGVPLRVLLG